LVGMEMPSMPRQEFSIFIYFLFDMSLYLISLQQDRNTPNLANHINLW
jgi:hypothetical protein